MTIRARVEKLERATGAMLPDGPGMLVPDVAPDAETWAAQVQREMEYFRLHGEYPPSDLHKIYAGRKRR